MFLLNFGFLASFQEIEGNISGKILQGLYLIFGSVSIFLKVIEKHLFKKIQKHEKQKSLKAKSTRFETWFRRRCQTIKFLKVSLKKSFLKQKNTGRKLKHTKVLMSWIWKLMRCCQRNRKVLFRINEHPSCKGGFTKQTTK